MEVIVDLKTVINKLQAAFDRIQKLEEENKKLRDALEFYANQKSWYGLSNDRDTVELSDCEPAESIIHEKGIMLGGRRARQVLKEVGEE